MLVLVALCAAIAVAPLWTQRRAVGILPQLLLTAVAAAVVLVAANAPPVVEASRPGPIEVLGRGYAGSAACRSCHPAEHASWHGSYHRSMTQVASHATLVPDFDRLELDWFGKPVLLEWRGDRLWAQFERGGRHPGPVERPVEQLTGSHHLQVLWYATGNGRELAPVPMCYKIAEGIWLPLTAVFVLPPEFVDPPDPGAWSQSCAMCHTTDPRPRVDIGRNDTQVSEFGIACESCHGPGAAHAAANKNPLRRHARRLAGHDDTIVDPAALPPARAAEVCGHCHSVSILREQHFDSWREHGSPFVPGGDLHATHLVIGVGERDAPELRHELRKNPDFFASSFWADGEVRLSGREFSALRASGCYTHGDRARQIHCGSCHAMHTPDGEVGGDWRAGQLRADRPGNTACTQCHAELSETAALAAHTRHAPDSPGSNCCDCHMAYTSVGLMKASRSHAISSPDVRRELATGRPNACNLCHLDRTLEWTAAHLQQWWQVPPPELDADQRTVAASILWLLTGDAGQRVLAAWNHGREVARAASGDDWSPPFLARLLDDPYYVVRFQAARSLRAIDGYANALGRYDFLADRPRAAVFVDNVTALWGARPRPGPRPAALLDERGLVRAVFDRLYARRDDRPVYLAE